MSKNFSTVLNVILAIAVAILFYLHFSNRNDSTFDEEQAVPLTDSVQPRVTMPSNKVKDAALAFVNSDSIFEHYDFYNKVKKETETKMTNLENSYKASAMKFQDDYNDYIDKAGKGMYSKEQGQKIEADLTSRKQKIDAMEMQVGTLQESADKAMNEVQMSLSTFFNQYAMDNRITCILTYNDRGEGAIGVDKKYDITSDAIKGLNAAYKASQNTVPTTQK